MKISRGDVILVLFPDSNLRTAKRRPALVVQADDLQTGLPQVIVSMITSNMARAGHPSRLKILRVSSKWQQTGLRTDSVIMTDNLATITHVEIDRVLGRLTDMRPVDDALCHTLGLVRRPLPRTSSPAEVGIEMPTASGSPDAEDCVSQNRQHQIQEGGTLDPR